MHCSLSLFKTASRFFCNFRFLFPSGLKSATTLYYLQCLFALKFSWSPPNLPLYTKKYNQNIVSHHLNSFLYSSNYNPTCFLI
ncbi:hypothetical protein CW304_22510 [Bacillus sp. UFRGS-B20]|nr:hypothetical protein CW304_22510 [Bacillus sp. UFRGS-B20]